MFRTGIQAVVGHARLETGVRGSLLVGTSQVEAYLPAATARYGYRMSVASLIGLSATWVSAEPSSTLADACFVPWRCLVSHVQICQETPELLMLLMHRGAGLLRVLLAGG